MVQLKALGATALVSSLLLAGAALAGGQETGTKGPQYDKGVQSQPGAVPQKEIEGRSGAEGMTTGPATGRSVEPSTAIQKEREGEPMGAPAAAGVPGAEGAPGTQSGR